jgi:SAM-dependent methyltransferase
MVTDNGVRQYFYERAEAERGLCSFVEGRLMLRPDITHYGCPYCQGQKHRPYTSALKSSTLACEYVRCQECGVVYPWPRLTREALNDRVNAAWLNRYLARSFENTRYWPDYRPVPERPFRRLADRRVLEVGPGPGVFLDYLKHIGADALGVEPNLIAARQCEKRGLRVINGTFDEKSLSEHDGIEREAFDAVVFLESIYHLFDLRAGLVFAHSLIRPGGLLILKAFDLDSLPVRCFPEASTGIDGLSIPTNASAQTYASLVEQCGFKIRQMCRLPGNPLGDLGLDRSQVAGVWWQRGLQAVDRLIDVVLRATGQTRNFILFAEKY